MKALIKGVIVLKLKEARAIIELLSMVPELKTLEKNSSNEYRIKTRNELIELMSTIRQKGIY